tara:strand:+ start:639 stop:887 length:249 start_codon:yes stop_codon:yes gene_type:complete
VRDLLIERSQAYKQTFDGELGGKVMADLERFCHANTTTHVVGDSHGTAQLEGRRQVWLRIQGYISLNEGDIGEMVETAETDG